uniref:PH domain-containing protein n=1 Tax=Noctiluca scintillans TaxID=2966 RepID=A0A7S1A7L5_NOCSC
MASVDLSQVRALGAEHWARGFADRVEREYSDMTDGLIAENEQLENLVRLLASQVSERVDATSSWAELEELLQRCLHDRTQREERLQELQKKVQEMELEAQSLRRQLEDALGELRNDSRPADVEHETGGDLSRRLQQSERARAHEVHRAELVEARCALVETRCRQAVKRLEDELAAIRMDGLPKRRSAAVSRSSTPRCSVGHMPGALSPGGSKPSETAQVNALLAQLEVERELHRNHIAMYQRHLPVCDKNAPESAAPSLDTVSHSGRFDLDLGRADASCDADFGCMTIPPSLVGHWTRNASPNVSPPSSCANSPNHWTGQHEENSTSPNKDDLASDEEDYNWESYLERSVGGSFLKVFVGLSSDQLRIFGERSEREPVDRYPLGLFDRPAKLLETGTGSKRCFEVSVRRGPDGLLVFRCVSERRASQWVDAINHALCRGRHPAGLRLINVTPVRPLSISTVAAPTPADMSPVMSPVGDRGESGLSRTGHAASAQSLSPPAVGTANRERRASAESATVFRAGSRRGSTARKLLHSVR